MIGGYVSCIRNNWTPLNPGEEYNKLEAEGLNKLGICFHGKGTDNYNISLNSSNNWYLKDDPTNIKNLGEILNDLRDKNIKELDSKVNNNSDNVFNKALKKFYPALNCREKKNVIYENNERLLSRKTIKHMNYINNLQSFIERLNSDSEYIELHRKIKKENPNRKTSRSRSRSRSNRRSRSRSNRSNRSSSFKKTRSNRSRGKNKKTKKKKN